MITTEQYICSAPSSTRALSQKSAAMSPCRALFVARAAPTNKVPPADVCTGPHASTRSCYPPRGHAFIAAKSHPAYERFHCSSRADPSVKMYNAKKGIVTEPWLLNYRNRILFQANTLSIVETPLVMTFPADWLANQSTLSLSHT